MYKFYATLLFLLPIAFVSLTIVDRRFISGPFFGTFLIVSLLSYVTFALYLIFETFFTLNSKNFVVKLLSRVQKKFPKVKLGAAGNFINSLVTFLLVGFGSGLIVFCTFLAAIWVSKMTFHYDIISSTSLSDTKSRLSALEEKIDGMVTSEFFQSNEYLYTTELGDVVYALNYVGFGTFHDGSYVVNFELATYSPDSPYRVISDPDSQYSYVRFSSSEEILSFDVAPVETEFSDLPLLVFKVNTDRRSFEFLAKPNKVQGANGYVLIDLYKDYDVLFENNFEVSEDGEDFVIFAEYNATDNETPFRYVKLMVEGDSISHIAGI